VLNERFILGLDLDGTCADFYGRMREVAAQFTGRPLEDLPEEVDWSLSAWGIGEERYEELHRYAVTEHGLFESMAPLPGSTEALRRLVGEGVGVRVITHRLILPSLHAETVRQTVRWLDEHRIPYWDLCFMRAKDGVDADLYVEDSSSNIERLLEVGADVLVIDNPTNRHHEFPGCSARRGLGAGRGARPRPLPGLARRAGARATASTRRVPLLVRRRQRSALASARALSHRPR
jgi:5'(3')-deoxyribonucleotidase